MSNNRRPGTRGDREPSRKHKKTKFLSRYYNKPSDLVILKKIAREEKNPLIRLIACGLADRLQSERGQYE